MKTILLIAIGAFLCYKGERLYWSASRQVKAAIHTTQHKAAESIRRGTDNLLELGAR